MPRLPVRCLEIAFLLSNTPLMRGCRLFGNPFAVCFSVLPDEDKAVLYNFLIVPPWWNDRLT